MSAPPFDVAEVIHRVHLAYRPSARGGFVGGGDTYEVDVAEDGSTRVATLPGEEPRAPRTNVAELRLAPARFERGGRTLASAVGVRAVADDGHLTIDRGDHVEHLRNEDGSLEQSWSFATKPPGQGDLRLAIGVTGSRYAKTTETGVHFVREGSTLGFRYGHATFVDAEGTRTAVPVAFESGELVMNVPARTLETARYPIVIDPTVTAELGTDAPVPGVAVPAQDTAIAWGGTQYLVVWTDARNAGGWQPGIYGTRLTAAGVVVDIGGIPIGTTTEAVHSTVVASNDPDFLVVWGQTVAATSTDDLKGVRVTSAGAVLDATPLVVSSAVDDQTDPTIASDGTDYAVAWRDYRTGTRWDVFATRVTAAGVVQDAAGRSVATTATRPSIASNGTGYVIAYQSTVATDSNVLSRTMASATGNVGSAVTIAANATYDEYAPSIASNGTGYLVVWQDARNDATNNEDLFAARLSAAGAYVAASEFVIASTTNHETDPWVSRYGVDYFLLFGRASANFPNNVSWIADRVLSTGSVASSNVLNGNGPGGFYGSRALAASDGSTVMVASYDDNAWITAVTYSGSTMSMREINAAVVANVQTDPAIAFNGSTYLLAWRDQRATTFASAADEVYAVRIGTSGAVLDPSGMDVGSGTVPAVASNGTDFLVGWSSTSSVRVRRVSGAGAFLDASYISSNVAKPTVGGPSLAWNGASYLIVGQGQARRISSAGALDATTLTVGGTDAAVASNGTDFLIAFRTGASNYDIGAQRVSGAGVVLDASALVVSAAANTQQRPSVASDGTGYLVAWDDARNATTDVYGSRVTSAGAVSDGSGLAIASETGAQITPSVAWDGTEYAVIWDDHRGATSDIYGTRVYPNGSVESATVGTVLSADTTVDEKAPFIARGPSLTFLLAYHHLKWPAPYAGVSRVYSRSLTYGSGTGSVCNGSGDCDSGMCVDGVCCTTPCAGGTTDCMACSIAAGAAMDGTCSTVLGTTHVCRAATGVCDRAETCLGAASCPADAMEPVTTPCRASVDFCDTAETCTGSLPTCPSDGYVAAATPCRAVAGGCDVAEACTGSSPYCPTDGYMLPSTVCRSAPTICDVPEVCSGTDASCPGDSVVPMGTPCRLVAGPCDVAESCNGVAPTCPIDSFKGNTSQCDISHGICDFADFCTGVDAACPEDALPDGTSCDDTKSCTTGDQCTAGVCAGAIADASTVCHASSGPCDVVETCDGVTDTCPTDSFLPASSMCRPSGGMCDPAEFCVGVSAACPGDVKAPSGTPCRTATGTCDLEEQCDGSTSTCPTDLYKFAGASCRPTASVCDLAETCVGGTAQCPTDGYLADGTTCDDGLTCTLTSACQLGACAPALTLDCSDGNSCTTDTCAEPSGCAHSLVPVCAADAGTDGGHAGTDAGTNPGTDGGTTAPPAQGGCSCRVDGSTSPTSVSLALVLLTLAVLRTRRRPAQRRLR